MYHKSLFLLILSISLIVSLTSCASFRYTKTEDLSDSCIDAAKVKMAHYAGSCELLREISYKDYKRAVTAGNAWIKAHDLDYKQIQNIRRGSVWVGMPADAAKLAWGAPRTVKKTQSFQHHEEWQYASGNSLLINDGKVTEIHN
jgi:hypothetical protein